MNARDLVILFISLLIGGLCALVARSAFHKPHDVPIASQQRGPVATMDHAYHAGHADHPTTNHSVTAQPINSICSICGMDVDKDLPTAQYQGKTIGFACKKCPPLFAKDPDRYGPFYLKNEKMPK